VALRLVLVVVLVLVGAGVTIAYRRRRAHDEHRGAVDPGTGARRWPDLPDELASTGTDVPAPATWVIFTTPLCVSCESVRTDLAAHDPDARVLTVDATVAPHLAERYDVRRAPTTILADGDGHVVERLVGPEGVRAHLRRLDDGARTR
jgi:hypothetical protein